VRKGRSSAITRAATWCFVLIGLSCSSESGPTVGGQTNWLSACQSDDDCGKYSCVCGTCTQLCERSDDCLDLPTSSCLLSDEPGLVAQCDGQKPELPGACLPSCQVDACPQNTSCVAGLCGATPEPTTTVSVDDRTRFQTLVGIGATVAYNVDELVGRADKAELFDAFFLEAGFGIIKLRNLVYPEAAADVLEGTVEVIAAATARLGHAPIVLLESTSPPSILKANASTWCEGNPETCTLARTTAGGFDYAGLADYWRLSLEAYQGAGILPDYISLQNNVDYVPPTGHPAEACHFLPTEGSVAVATDSGSVSVEYPGYREALEALQPVLEGFASPPKVVVPDTTGPDKVTDYLDALELGTVDAIGHHFYGMDPAAIDTAGLEVLAELSATSNLPLFQTELEADALSTAKFLHAALVTEGAAAYIHHPLAVTPTVLEESKSLVNLLEDGFAVSEIYHVMTHYSRYVAAGWQRVSAAVTPGGVLASAWSSPDGSQKAVILTNPATTRAVVELEGISVSLGSSAVIRTVLGGMEQHQLLGELSGDRIVVVPGQSLVTVTY